MRKKPLRSLDAHLAGLLLAAVTLLIIAELILARAAPRLASPISPLVLALFFVATMLGIPAATGRDAHIRLGLLSRLLPERAGRALRLVGLVAALAFFAALLFTGARLCWGQARGHNRALLSWCPDWIVTLSVPLAAALSCLRAVQAWRAARRGPAAAEDEWSPPR